MGCARRQEHPCRGAACDQINMRWTVFRRFAISCLSCWLCALPAIARTRPHYGGALLVETAGDPWQRPDGLARRLVFDGLTRIDANGSVQPALAVGWEIRQRRSSLAVPSASGRAFSRRLAADLDSRCRLAQSQLPATAHGPRFMRSAHRLCLPPTADAQSARSACGRRVSDFARRRGGWYNTARQHRNRPISGRCLRQWRAVTQGK